VRIVQRILLVLAAVLVPAAAGASFAAAGFSGTFATRISGSPMPRFDGVWTMKLAPSGNYTIALGSQTLIRGSATVSGSKITFGRESGPAACTGAAATGVYSWHLSGKTLRFTRVADICLGRRVVLAHQFTKTS
jgi:hypothetical protein